MILPLSSTYFNTAGRGNITIPTSGCSRRPKHHSLSHLGALGLQNDLTRSNKSFSSCITVLFESSSGPRYRTSSRAFSFCALGMVSLASTTAYARCGAWKVFSTPSPTLCVTVAGLRARPAASLGPPGRTWLLQLGPYLLEYFVGLVRTLCRMNKTMF